MNYPAFKGELAMDKKPLISVIVPVRNTKQYLEKCLDSLINQTYQNMEIIVIDDASTEDISPIVDRYKSLSNKTVLLIRNNNKQSIGEVRNQALSIVSGEFIAFCDSDDWLDLNTYQYCMEAISRTEADVAVFSQIRCFENNREPIFKTFYDTEYVLNSDTALKIMSKSYDCGIAIAPPVTNKLFKKSIINEMSLMFLPIDMFEDLVFSYKYFTRSKKIVCVPNVKYHHLKRTNSVVQSFKPKYIDDFEKAFGHIQEFLKNAGLYEHYKFHFFCFCEHFFNLLLREIHQFVSDDELKKQYTLKCFDLYKCIIPFEEYVDYISADKLRRHLQPFVKDTNID